MAYYNFVDDLEVAKKTEKEIVEILSRKYSTFKFLSFSNHEFWDIKCKINGKIYYIEVKEDFYCKKSGNVAVEFECRGKPSGILISKADFFIYKVHDISSIKYVLYTKKQLNNIIEKKLYSRIAVGGDKGSNTKMYLFKKSIFYTNADRHLLTLFNGKSL